MPRRPVAVLATIVIIVALAILAGFSPFRWYEAALVLADLAAGAKPTRLKAGTPTPKRIGIPYTVEGRTYRGDLYLPGERPEAGLVLLPGAAEQGKDDPRLVAFALTLARARFAVLVPDMEGFRSLQVGSRDIGETADAFAYLSSRPDLAPGGKCGIAAISYAAGPAVLAALEHRVRDRVRFIVTIGGYYNLTNVLTFFTTGWYRDGERWRHMEPNHYGKWVFVLSNIDRLSDPADRKLFRIAAGRKMDDINAPIDDLAARLGPEGSSLYEFIVNTEPRRVPLLIERLPVAIRREMALLDPSSRDLAGLTARMVIVHGRDDDIIPAAESIALAGAVPAHRRRLFVTEGLMHAELKPGLADAWRLWRAVCAILRERDRR
jgi:pimeloyl-ACP methyl ester carboxylesterase